MGAVSNVVESVGNVVGGVVDAVSDVGSFIDDAVNDVVPAGWLGVAAIAAPFVAPELLAAEGALEAGAAAEGATGLATLGESVLPATEAFATGSELAAIPEAASSFGLSAAAPTAEFGTFNPATTAGIGIQAPELSTLGQLGGTAAMDVGTAGLTAEQLANATSAAQVGSNAASGLGYLGGAESLPSGTAGITGVTSTPVWDSVKNSLSDIGNPLGQSLSGSNTAYLLAKGLTGGNQSSLHKYDMNQSPFSYMPAQPIQGGNTTSTVPQELQQQNQMNALASLLRKS